jgi:Tol biopolymer transport system component
MKKMILFSIFVLILLTGFNCNENDDQGEQDSQPASGFTNLSGPYLGQNPPGNIPVLFVPDILLSNQTCWWHGILAFSPDSQELFMDMIYSDDRISVDIMIIENDLWTSPVTATFSEGYPTSSPCISTDGNKIFFISERPQRNVYFSTRINSEWSDPNSLNLTGQFGWSLSVAQNENIYVQTTSDSGGYGLYDIVKYDLINESYIQPENLGDSINTAFNELCPFIDPTENYLIFASDRPGGYGSYDLYISFKRNDGTWTSAQNMGEIINSAAEDLSPYISPDGLYLFFASARQGDRNPYWVDAGIIENFTSF